MLVGKFKPNLLISLTIALSILLVPLSVRAAAWSGPRAGSSPIEPAAPRVPCDTTIRIMPLGDSITRGNSSGVSDPAAQVSYRKDLWNSLKRAGYEVDFVGSQVNGQAYEGFDADHEGHGGYRDDQVALNIYNNGGENWLGKNHADIILLHIGTNWLDTSPADVGAILDEIDEYEADTGRHVTVILARIINRVPYSHNTTKFNDNVQAMAEARLDDDVIIVDMERGAGLIYEIQPQGDFWDNLHPFESGYAKMAAAWKGAIDEYLQPCNFPAVLENSVYLPVAVKANFPFR